MRHFQNCKKEKSNSIIVKELSSTYSGDNRFKIKTKKIP